MRADAQSQIVAAGGGGEREMWARVCVCVCRRWGEYLKVYLCLLRNPQHPGDRVADISSLVVAVFFKRNSYFAFPSMHLVILHIGAG